MFIIQIIPDIDASYPKYLILPTHITYFTVGIDEAFYYLVANTLCLDFFKKGTFPTFIVIIDFYFDRGLKSGKFNLSKLGTDYLFNYLARPYNIDSSFKSDCLGVFPINYIYVIKPNWP